MNDPPMQATPDEIVTEAMIEASPYRLGDPHYDGECWSAEIQVVGGHEVVAEVYGDSEADVLAKQKAVFVALARTLEVSPPPTDLVERLRDGDDLHSRIEAAAELTRISADNAAKDAALNLVAGMIRQGPETDVLAWKSLADACQHVARTALEDNHANWK